MEWLVDGWKPRTAAVLIGDVGLSVEAPGDIESGNYSR